MYYHCIVFFDVRNLVLCLTRELIKFIDYKIMLTKSSKSNKSRLWNNVFKKCGFI